MHRAARTLMSAVYYSGLLALMGYIALISSPLVWLSLASWLGWFNSPGAETQVILTYLLYPLSYFGVAFLLAKIAAKDGGDMRELVLKLIVALLRAAAVTHTFVLVYTIASTAISETAASLLAPATIWLLESVPPLMASFKRNGETPGKSLRFIADEGGRILRAGSAPIVLAAANGAALMGVSSLLPPSFGPSLKLVMNSDNEAPKTTDVLDLYDGDRAIIKEQRDGKPAIYRQINLSDGYAVIEK